METEPNITIAELSERIGITERAIKKNIASLQKAGGITRMGFAKSGHWEVVD